MAVAVREETTTGIRRAELRKLALPQKRALDAWLWLNSGIDGSRRYVPGRIRRLCAEHLQDVLELAASESLTADWQERERRRCDADVHYFIDGYGHLRPEVGEAIPFYLWPEQREVLTAFVEELRVIVLKARQLGLTWLALHYAVWRMRVIANFRTLALSKHGGDATKLVERARHINDLLPPFLRMREDRAFAESLTRFKTGEGGEILSLTSSPASARQETAGLAILDEAGFVKNKAFGSVWTAVQPTLGQSGQAFVLSTGNGPPQADKDGAAFATLYLGSKAGSTGIRSIFLPDATHPGRSAAWRKAERAKYLSDEEFEAEHPETEEQALAGIGGTPVYPLANIAAAEAKGVELDAELASGQIAPPADVLAAGIDWGEKTHILTIWPLERGGIYVMPGEVHSAHQEPGAVTKAYIEEVRRVVPPKAIRQGKSTDPFRRIAKARYDAAGVQSQRTFIANARRPHPRIESHPVPFGAKMDERSRSYKRETVNYLRRLFKRTAEGEETQIIAISPKCVELLRQLRGLRFRDDDSGDVEKGDDHGPDALLAGSAPIARRFRALLVEERTADE